MRPPSSTWAVVATAERDVRELLDEQHADAGFGDLLDHGHQALHDDGSETERELVDHEHLRLRHERLRQHHHLLLATGEQSATDLPALLQLGEQRQRVLDALGRGRPGQRVGGDPHVLLDREIGEQPPPFGHHRHTGGADLLGASVGDRLTVDEHLARRDAQQAGDRRGECGLAGAVRPEHGGHLTGRHLEAHAVHDAPGGAVDHDVVDLHQGTAHEPPTTVSSTSSPPR